MRLERPTLPVKPNRLSRQPLMLMTAATTEGDMFATKLDPSGANLFYSTMIGGTELDEAHAIDVDSIGTAFITGWAGYNFPGTAGAYHSHDNSEDAVVLRLAMSGRW